MTNYIRKHREKRRYTRERLAALVGTSTSQITKLERGERKLTQDWIERLSNALNVPPVSLISAWAIDVIGRVETDGAIVYREKGGEASIEEVEAPAQAAASTVAVEVYKDALTGFADDGAILFFDWMAPSIIGTMLGKMAVVWCKDGRVLVRRIFPGTTANTWTLVSSSGKAEYDVELKQAIKISWMRLP